jgi:hypothetical protein
LAGLISPEASVLGWKTDGCLLAVSPHDLSSVSFSSYEDTSVIGLGPNHNSLILSLLPLSKPCLQIQSYSEVLGLKLGM